VKFAEASATPDGASKYFTRALVVHRVEVAGCISVTWPVLTHDCERNDRDVVPPARV
jgi:hypothetical protein